MQRAASEEREKFIEQFWQRRDPTPGTLENECKEEHYRRIALASFAFINRPGAGDFAPSAPLVLTAVQPRGASELARTWARRG